MVEHCLGMTGTVVRFYVGAPIDTQTERQYNKRMYKIINKAGVELDECQTLDLAMAAAKRFGFFVTIKGPEFEVCGMFGVDSVKDGLCPDGVKYDWNKASRIGAVKRR